MGYRGRRRNLAWWRNKPIARPNAISTGNTPSFRTVSNTPTAPAPAGYRYVGYCRCGYGPNAYYQTPDGRVIPAYQLYTGGVPQPQYSYPSFPVSSLDKEKVLKERLERLQEEIADVTNQLEDLEGKKEGKKKRFPLKWRLK